MERRIYRLILGIAFGAVLVGPRAALAQYYDQGEEQVSISVDKKVRYIHSDKYYDNIDASQQVFFDGEVIDYKIFVENTGNKDLYNISFTDYLPTNIEVIVWFGTFDPASRKVTWTLDSLKAGEVKDFLIRIRIVEVTKLALVGNMRLTNKVEVKVEGMADEDSASIYVGQKLVPKTGDNTLLIKTLFGLGLLAMAIGTRKVARGY